MKKIVNSILLVVLVAGLFSCNKASLNPTLAQQKLISVKTANDLQGILNGALDDMTYYTYYGRDYIIFGEVRSDNCFSNGNSGRFLNPAQMKMGSDDAYAHDTWLQMYKVIANANMIIGQDPAKITGSKTEINNIIGQAYAIRALVHFDLLKLYGEENVTGGNNLGIPYVTTFHGSDITPARNTVQENLTSIQADLNMALSLMTPASSIGQSTREYVTNWAVWALKSRVDLYFGEYDSCAAACEKVIGSGEYAIAAPSDYAATFSTKDAYNVIFELAERPTDNQNINGLSYIYRGDNYGDIQALDNLYTIFDATDVRRASDMLAYVGSALRNIGKYPTNSNYDYDIPLIRYEEVILNYAEALYHQGNTTEALAELNKITANRNATAYTTVDEATILLERRKELCFEGFRFDDLARTHQGIPLVDPLHQTMGTVNYGDYNYAFPIPIDEIHANSNMVQNVGY